MLRPTHSLLDSSRAARRANVRAERVKAVGEAARGLYGVVVALLGAAVELVLLWTLPFLYLAASYLALDLPARWLMHRPAFGSLGALLFAGAVVVGLVGLARALRGAEPVVPVRPRFAKVMLGLSWFAALVLTIGDLVS